MSEFLKVWDEAIRQAQERGYPSMVFKRIPEFGTVKVAARTMHPAFMQPKVPKHDPRRGHGEA